MLRPRAWSWRQPPGPASAAGSDGDPDLRLPAGFDYPILLPLPFAHGVASGDPLKDRVILWTRITVPDPTAIPSVEVGWEVRSDPEMTTPVVASGTVTTDASRDYTVKVDAGGLAPQTTYYYRFTALGRTSITGRTRTAVADPVSELRFVVASCSSYWSVVRWDGMRRISERNDIDLVIHCGDYVYDYPDEDEWVRAPGKTDPTTFDVNDVDFRRWTNISELRRRYALYKADPDHCAMHQQHPMFILWDNHDLSSGVDNGTTLAENTQVFWEWTPSRPPKGDGLGEFPAPSSGQVTPENTNYVYRTLPYGPLADLRTIDVRHIGVDDPAQGGDPTNPKGGAASATGNLLGATQLTWLEDNLYRSKHTTKATWRLIVNGYPFGQFATDQPQIATITGSANPLPSDYGAWDRYPDERARIVKYLRQNGIDNNLIMTGDAHGNFLWDVTDDDSVANYNPATGTTATGGVGSVGVEFLPTSLGRGGATETLASIAYMETHNGQHPYGDRTGFAPFLAAAQAATVPFDAAVMSQNASMQYLEWYQHGYGVVNLTAAKATFEYWWGPIRTTSDTETLGSQWQTLTGVDHATQVLPAVATTGSRVSAPAPAFEVTPPTSLPEVGTPAVLVGVGAAAAAAVFALRNRARSGPAVSEDQPAV